MKNGYEYYYLFGLDIPLEEFGLGVIKQPKIVDFLSKDIEIESFYHSFITIDYLSKTSESLVEAKDKFGRFALLVYLCQQINDFSNIKELAKRIGFLYGTDNVEFNEFGITIKNVVEDKGNPGEFKDIVINNDNFDKLCDVVLEMCKIDKSEIDFDKVLKREMSDIEKEFERRRKAHLEKLKGKSKDDKLTILDVANSIIHSSDFKYDDVLNMTIYQLKNTRESLSIKEAFDIDTLCRISPKFDFSKEKFEHWTGKIKINKSRLAD